MSRYFSFVNILIILGFMFFVQCNLDDAREEELLKGLTDSIRSDLILESDIAKIPFDVQHEVKDTLKAIELGRLFFHDSRMGVHGGSCAGCHNIEKGGFSGNDFGIGGRGIFDELLKKYDSTAVVDVQDKRTPAIVNSYTVKNALWDGSMGAGGWNRGLPDSIISTHEENFLETDGIFVQALKGQGVHFIDANLCRGDTLYQRLVREAFEVPYLDDVQLAQAITLFEQSITASEAPFQQWIRGDSISDKSWMEGAVLFFQSNCMDCHSGPALGNEVLSPKLAASEWKGRFEFTKDTADMNMVKVPQLYNLRDTEGFLGHNSSVSGIERMIKRHPNSFELSEEEIVAIARFIREGLCDKELDRFLE